MKRFLVRLLINFVVGTGLYGWWNRVRRPLEKGSEEWPPVREVSCIKEASDLMTRYSYLWRRDRLLWSLGDLISFPTKLEAAIVREEANELVNQAAHTARSHMIQKFQDGLDCDEFATWGCTALRQLGKGTSLLQVTWSAPDGVVEGHHLCAVTMEDGFYLYGNWGEMGPFLSLPEAARVVARRGGGEILTAWACFLPKHLVAWLRVI